LVVNEDESAGGVLALGGERVLGEPGVERVDTRSELGAVVGVVESLDSH